MKQKPVGQYAIFAIVLLSIFFTISLSGCDQRSNVKEKTDTSNESSSTNISSNSKIPDDLPQQKASLPSFTLFKDKSYEDAGTAKVIWEILVSPDITKESLTSLLNDLYAQANSKRFQQHNNATVIDIKAYASKEHAESGMGQWIGWINKLGGQNQPKISFDDRQISQLGRKAEEKSGLNEDVRKKIWQEAVVAEDRADKEAEQKYPEPNPQNRDAFMAAYEKRDKLRKQLINKFRNELAKKYRLTREQLDEIRYEGLKKSWPLPD